MGSKYKHSRPIDYPFATGTAIAAGQTRYFVNDIATAGVGPTNWIVTRPVTIDRIFARSSVAPGVGETYVFTLMVNNVASIITVTIAGAAATDANSFANTINLVAGDEISMRIVASVAAAGASISATVAGKY